MLSPRLIDRAGWQMRRREIITLLGGTAAAWPLAVRAQQRPAMPVIGVLYGVSAADLTAEMIWFRRGLAEGGFVDGRNQERWAEGQYNRLPAMAAELVGRKVTVILAGGSIFSVQAAMAATRSIPIVFTTNNDAGAAVHPGRTDHQQEDCEGVWLDLPADAARARRRSD
jgi:putative ABC transport system substrate-binding protein